MKIGIAGFDFESSNKGCEALTYSFVNMLLECFGNDLKIINYSYLKDGMMPRKSNMDKSMLKSLHLPA